MILWSMYRTQCVLAIMIIATLHRSYADLTCDFGVRTRTSDAGLNECGITHGSSPPAWGVVSRRGNHGKPPSGGWNDGFLITTVGGENLQIRAIFQLPNLNLAQNSGLLSFHYKFFNPGESILTISVCGSIIHDVTQNSNIRWEIVENIRIYCNGREPTVTFTASWSLSSGRVVVDNIWVVSTSPPTTTTKATTTTDLKSSTSTKRTMNTMTKHRTNTTKHTTTTLTTSEWTPRSTGSDSTTTAVVDIIFTEPLVSIPIRLDLTCEFGKRSWWSDAGLNECGITQASSPPAWRTVSGRGSNGYAPQGGKNDGFLITTGGRKNTQIQAIFQLPNLNLAQNSGLLSFHYKFFNPGENLLMISVCGLISSDVTLQSNGNWKMVENIRIYCNGQKPTVTFIAERSLSSGRVAVDNIRVVSTSPPHFMCDFGKRWTWTGLKECGITQASSPAWGTVSSWGSHGYPPSGGWNDGFLLGQRVNMQMSAVFQLPNLNLRLNSGLLSFHYKFFNPGENLLMISVCGLIRDDINLQSNGNWNMVENIRIYCNGRKPTVTFTAVWSMSSGRVAMDNIRVVSTSPPTTTTTTLKSSTSTNRTMNTTTKHRTNTTDHTTTTVTTSEWTRSSLRSTEAKKSLRTVVAVSLTIVVIVIVIVLFAVFIKRRKSRRSSKVNREGQEIIMSRSLNHNRENGYEIDNQTAMSSTYDTIHEGVNPVQQSDQASNGDNGTEEMVVNILYQSVDKDDFDMIPNAKGGVNPVQQSDQASNGDYGPEEMVVNILYQSVDKDDFDIIPAL